MGVHPLRLDQRQAQLVHSLRRLFVGYDDSAREHVARDGVLLIRGFLLTQGSTWRFAFRGDYDEAVSNVAHDVMTGLLTPVREPAGVLSFSSLRRWMATAVVSLEHDSCCTPAAELLDLGFDACPDDLLLHAFRRLAFKLATQRVSAQRRALHAHQARLARNITRLCRKGGSIKVIRGLWGSRLLVSEYSDQSFGQIPRSDLLVILGPGELFTAREILARLAGHLTPEDGHGGHCYLWDVVTAAFELRHASLRRHVEESDRLWRNHRWVEPGETQRAIAELRRSLAATAGRILDERRKAATGRDRSLWIAVTVESFLAQYESEREELRGFSLRRMLEAECGEEGCREEIARHSVQVNYLLKQLRRRWATR